MIQTPKMNEKSFNSNNFLFENINDDTCYLEQDLFDITDIENLSSPSPIGTNIGSGYIMSYPRNIDIFTEIQNFLPNIIDENIRIFLKEFISTFQKTLILYYNTLDFKGILPPLSINQLDDNSIHIEWIFKDFRIGFSIETDIKQSNWYLISNKNLDERCESRLINKKNFESVISYLISFVIHNT